MRAWLLLFLLLPLLLPPGAAEVSLGTALPGHRDPSAWYGHSALVVETEEGIDYYTYRLRWAPGVPEALSSAFGLSTFRLERMPLDQAIADYQIQGRELRLTPLPMSPDQEESLVAMLMDEIDATHFDPPAYDAIADNCGTRIRSIIDAAYGGALAEQDKGVPAGTTREIFRPYMAHDLAVQAGLGIVLGPLVDRPLDRWDAAFMPLELEASVQQLTGTQATVVQTADADVLAPPADLRIVIVPVLLAIAILVIGILAALGHIAPWSPAALIALTSMLLTPVALLITVGWIGGMGPFGFNMNVLLLSPLVPWIFAEGTRHVNNPSDRLEILLLAQMILAVAAVVPWAIGVQDMGVWVALLAPLHIASWLAIRWVNRASVPGGSARPLTRA